MALTKADTLRLVLMRIDEWDTEVPGTEFFDDDHLNDRVRANSVESILTEAPEAALDHG